MKSFIFVNTRESFCAKIVSSRHWKYVITVFIGITFAMCFDFEDDRCNNVSLIRF